MTSSVSSRAARRSPLSGVALLLLLSVVLATVAVGPGAPPAAHADAPSPAPVALGAAANFSILGSSVSNTDTSVFEHDVGASPGAIVGFPPGSTSGVIHTNDKAAMDGLTAVAAAYSDAASRTATGSISGDLGAVTLTPGVYHSAAAISNTGTLTLDGQGNTNSVFIFQIEAALGMAAGAKVNLANGAKATNVFWQVQAAVAIGAGASFSGTLLGNASISLGADDTVVGGALTQNGAVAIDSSSVSTSPGFGGAGSAPLLVPLGSAGNFSFLGSSISNTAATHSNLDVGTHPGAITGFPPGTTSGTIHPNDAAASTALNDLTTAYTAAATRSQTAVIAGDLNGQYFTAGVYRAAAAIGVTGIVTLDGGGDPSSVFIFQIKAALSIAAGAQIILINGAQPGNVFWQTAGAATIGVNARFTGTILGNAAISIDSGVTLAGAALTQNGAITLDGTAVTSSPGYAGTLSNTISGASFSSAILSGLSVVLTSASQKQWTVTDSRMKPTPWDLTATATPLTSAPGPVDTTPRTLPPGSLTITPGTITALSGNTSTVHTQTVALTTMPRRIAWSIGSNATLAFTPTFTLTIPANAYRSNFSGSISDANSNPYISTITVTIG